MMIPGTDKNSLRANVLQARKALSPEQRSLFSDSIINTLSTHLKTQKPRTENLLTYRSVASEVNTEVMFNWPEFHTYAPVTHHHDHMEWLEADANTVWQAGIFGVLEPQNAASWQAGKNLTTVICPLAGFDRSGNRLGMGKGCFDFWFAEHRHHIQQVIGLAFSCQELAELPAEEHDAPMDFIITEKEVIRCQKV